MKSSLCVLLLLPAAITAPAVCHAQDYPVRTVRILVAYTPGGGTDLLGRLLAEITRIMSQADIKEMVALQGADAVTSTPQAFVDWVRQETALYAKIIKTANIRIEL